MSVVGHSSPERLDKILRLLRRKNRAMSAADVASAVDESVVGATRDLERLADLGLAEPGPNTPARTWRIKHG